MEDPSDRRRAAARTGLVALAAIVALRCVAAAAVAPPDPRPPPDPVLVDLASDPAWRLAMLPGVGPVLAARIVATRAGPDPPRDARDLVAVPGIGPHTVARLHASGMLARAASRSMPPMDDDLAPPPPEAWADLVAMALREDHADADLTSAVLPPDDRPATAEMIVKAPGVLCGLEVACAVLVRLDPDVALERLAEDGDTVGAGTVVLRAHGRARALLRGERTALNFVQRLSGIATLTAAFAERTMATRAGVYDTRKTTPGWRALEKYAVRCGGGRNHRMHLADAAMIKENHLVATYGDTGPRNLARGVRALLDALAPPTAVYVEVESEAELEAALEAAGPERGRLVLMLDDFELGAMRAAVRRVQSLEPPRPALELTGGVTLERIEALAATGVGRISSGALTHSARALDVSFKLVR